MYENIMNAMGLENSDIQCRNASRWYYSNPGGEYFYNKEGELLDVRLFIPDASEQLKAKDSLDNYDSQDAPEDKRIDGAIRWFLANTSEGNRNMNIFKLGMLIKDPSKINSSQWEMWMRKFNSMLSDPLPEREVNTIVRSVATR